MAGMAAAKCRHRARRNSISLAPGRAYLPTPAVAAIAGKVAFYDEKVDTFVDDIVLDRPVTHFFRD
jgi:hypothetical protein